MVAVGVVLDLVAVETVGVAALLALCVAVVVPMPAGLLGMAGALVICLLLVVVVTSPAVVG